MRTKCDKRVKCLIVKALNQNLCQLKPTVWYFFESSSKDEVYVSLREFNVIVKLKITKCWLFDIIYCIVYIILCDIFSSNSRKVFLHTEAWLFCKRCCNCRIIWWCGNVFLWKLVFEVLLSSDVCNRKHFNECLNNSVN